LLNPNQQKAEILPRHGYISAQNLILLSKQFSHAHTVLVYK